MSHSHTVGKHPLRHQARGQTRRRQLQGLVGFIRRDIPSCQKIAVDVRVGGPRIMFRADVGRCGEVEHLQLDRFTGLKTGAHAIALLDYRNSIKISRAHGSDIYEEKTETAYLPLLRFSASNLNAIFFVSKDGKSYFEEKTKMKNPDFFVSYLGVNRPDFDITKAKRSNKYVIVSCSNMIPLKRIDLIIYALASVKCAREIEWFHFGDGILRTGLEEIAGKTLGSLKGITYRFMGYYPNDDLLRFYSANRVDLFINASSTEGVPVSIMEAQSFGIPVIATDVGGVNEVVNEGTGSLMQADFSPEDLAQLIEHYSGLNEKESDGIRANAMRNWELNFNSATNYQEFILKVNSILASEKEHTQTL